MIDVRHNAHIAAAKAAVRPTRWWVALVAAVGAILVSEAVGFETPRDILDPGAESAALQVLDGFAGLVLIVLVMLWLRIKEGRPGRSVGLTGSRPALRFAAGVLIGGAMLAAGMLLMLGAGGIERIHHPVGVATGGSALLAAALLGGAWALQATSEEVVIRGFLFQWSGLQLPPGAAILVPVVAFAALHLAVPGALAPLPILNLLLFGVFAAIVALADRGLWMIAGIHTGWNWAQGNVMGMSAGGRLKDHTILAFGPVHGRPSAISGGDFGLQATVGATLVLAIATVVALRVLKARQAAWSAQAGTRK